MQSASERILQFGWTVCVVERTRSPSNSRDRIRRTRRAAPRLFRATVWPSAERIGRQPLDLLVCAPGGRVGQGSIIDQSSSAGVQVGDQCATFRIQCLALRRH